MPKRVPLPPLAPLDEYHEVQHAIRHIRVMERFFREVVDENPTYRDHYAALHVAYMRVLNDELAPIAVTLALAVSNLEDAYPEIDREVAE